MRVTDKLALIVGACHPSPPDDTLLKISTLTATRLNSPTRQKEQSIEGRYLTWSASYGEKKAKQIQRMLLAAKRNELHIEVAIIHF